MEAGSGICFCVLLVTLCYPLQCIAGKNGLSIFTFISFPNIGCSSAFGIAGTCYSIAECLRQQGFPEAPCARGYGVCCVFRRTCGAIVTHNSTYFTNPGYPGVFTENRTCTLTIGRRFSPAICQLRLDFEDFHLANPNDGRCETDSFTITGQNVNSVTPVICGVNSGQHIYVDVDTTGRPVQLNVITRGNRTRRWNIKVSEIECGNSCRAPSGCLQYYKGPSGVIRSFNFDPNNPPSISGGYLDNLNYAICFRRETGYCSIEYNVEPGSVFAIFNVDSADNPTTGPGEAGLGVQECPDDYILLGGIRYCGTRLNPSTATPNPTDSRPVIDTTNGPFTVQVVSNTGENANGYSLLYRQIRCP